MVAPRPSRSRRRLVTGLAVVAATLGLPTLTAPGALAQLPALPTSSPCGQLSPIAAPCVLAGKATESVAAECRRAGVADERCTDPTTRPVTRAARQAYLRSAVHRNAVFQSRLGDAVPLLQAQWLGTHNSFNSPSESPTISHSDSNQQLPLAQQLDLDIRALELDLHYLVRPTAARGREVVVCHGRPPGELDAGCTTEQRFSEVLAPVAAWLRASTNEDEVVLLYLEDALKNADAYASAVETLEGQLRRADGSSLIYHPAPTDRAANGCAPMPSGVTRDDIRDSGARVILVGNCAGGWAGTVFDWSGTHVEGGKTAAYRPFPACDATYGRNVYASKLVRYFEDSTFVATVVDPMRPPANPGALTPEKVAAMTGCGVGLYGWDQFLPDDGRIAASIWSWADGEPAGAGCTLQRADGRWAAEACSVRRRVACSAPSAGGPRWTVTTASLPFAAATAACRALDARFDVPRTGLQNNELRAAALAGQAVWIANRVKAERR